MKNKKHFIIYIAMIVTGVIIGWLIFGGKKESVPVTTKFQSEHQHIVWTCSMHPQIRMYEPGQCPICGMDLIPLNKDVNETSEYNRIQISESAMKLAQVQTTLVQKQAPVKPIRLTGKIMPDERNISVITSRFPGRIEKLFVNFTGQEVRQGEKLATIYSPDLITAQKELFETIKLKQSNPEYYTAARNKLKLWSVSDKQIDNIEKNGELQNYFDVLSPLGGTVLKKSVAIGEYVKEGDNLFEVADLSSVWIMFDAYENDLPWLKTGDVVNFEVQSLPGKTFTARISFIDPVVNAETRVASIRTETTNQSKLLKPEMFVRGVVNANLPDAINELVIPKTSVLWTGKKAIVYIKVQNEPAPTFEYREITLGEDAGNFYIVKSGLNVNDEIVTNGVFKIDAAAQLAGKQSMMNPEAGESMTGHQHSSTMPHSATNNLNLNEDAKAAVVKIIQAYLELKNHLVNDDLNASISSAGILKKLFEQTDLNLFESETNRIKWMKHRSVSLKALKEMEAESKLEQMRKSFKTLSDEIIAMSITFGPFDESFYVLHCPMADSERGADWLSSEKLIMNPYFGKSMLKCGEVTLEIKP